MLHIWMRQGAHMNESHHTYECVMSHVWTSHGTRMNASSLYTFATYTHIWNLYIFTMYIHIRRSPQDIYIHIKDLYTFSCMYIHTWPKGTPQNIHIHIKDLYVYTYVSSRHIYTYTYISWRHVYTYKRSLYIFYGFVCIYIHAQRAAPHESFRAAFQPRIHAFDITYPYVRHDSFTHAKCDMTHACVRHNSSICNRSTALCESWRAAIEPLIARL